MTAGAPNSAATARWRRGPLWAAAGALVLQSVVLYWPRPVPMGDPALPLDKVVHLVIFAVPTLLLVLGGLRPVWAAALVALHAPLSEILQHALLSTRSGDPADAVADVVGVVCRALLGMRLQRGRTATGPPEAH